jgi:hypothetical protein
MVYEYTLFYNRLTIYLLQMSMEERLNAISVEHPSHQTREPPQADTLARLLTQGLI